LDGPPDRCKACYAQRERIVKWRAIIRIGKFESASPNAAILEKAHASVSRWTSAMLSQCLKERDSEDDDAGDEKCGKCRTPTSRKCVKK
jgi:hypothetical protein